MICSMVRLFRIICIFAFGLLNVLSYDDAGVAIYPGVLNTTAVGLLQGPPAYDAVPDVIDASFNKTYSGVINTTEEAIYKFSYREIKNRVRVIFLFTSSNKGADHDLFVFYNRIILTPPPLYFDSPLLLL